MKRFFLFFALFLALSPLCKKATDGFALAKVSTHTLGEDPTPFDPHLLDQPFHYIAKGGQSYVFLSADGKTVLKLFRASRIKTLEALDSIFPFFGEKIAREKRALEETYISYLLAYTTLREETGLIATHLGAKAKVTQPLKIIDKLGIEHKIDPSKSPFIIQKRAILVKDQINEWMANNEMEMAKKGINALLNLLSRQMELGIEDMDPNLAKNFGFVGNEPIEIDGGRYRNAPTFSLERIEGSKEDLQHWINAHHPDLSSYFDATFQDWRTNYEPL